MSEEREALQVAHDLLQRAFHWIKDLRAGGHAFGCRGSEWLPPESREKCNCGRDQLLGEMAVAAFAPVDSNLNGLA